MEVILALTLLAAAPRRAGQEDLDENLEKAAEQILPDGGGQRLADLMRSDVGRMILKQRIAELADQDLKRIKKDPLKAYVEYLFTEDSEGKLHLRPEGRLPVALFWGDARSWELAWDEFIEGCREVARKIPTDREIDRRMKAYWEGESFPWARFSTLAGVSPWQEFGSTLGMFNVYFTRSLRRGPDGKLGVQALETLRTNLLWTVRHAEEAAASHPSFEEPYRRLLDLLQEPDRTAAATPAGREVLFQRWKKASAEGKDALSRLLAADCTGSPETGYRFKRDREVLKDIEVVEMMAQSLMPLFEKTARETAEDRDLLKRVKRILSEERCVYFAVGNMLDYKWKGGREARKEAVRRLRDEFLVPDGADRLEVRETWESVQALTAECDRLIAAAPLPKSDFKGLSRRMADPFLQKLYGSRAGCRSLEGFSQGEGGFPSHFRGTISEITVNAREKAVTRFLETYAVPQANRLALRPERAPEVEELFRRAVELGKALGGGKP